MFLACNIYVLERREVNAPWDRGRRGRLHVKVLKSPIVQENCSKVLLKVFCRAQSSRSAKLTNGLTAVLQSSRVRSTSTRLLPDKDTKKASLVK